MRLKLLWLGFGVFVFAIVIWTPGNAQCFSDRELRNVLRGILTYGIGQTVGVCIRKYPSLEDAALQTVESFQTSYSDEIRTLDRKTVAAFERNYPGQGKEARDENERRASMSAMIKAEAFTKTECEETLQGMKIMVRMNDWDKVMTPADASFTDNRKRVPRCN
jgi:hypothetical protein